MLKVTVLEGRQLLNVSGSVKCTVHLQQDTIAGRLHTSKPVEESFNPIWPDAVFDM